MAEVVEKFDYSKRDELIRGQTPEDIKQQCLELCKEYIGGVWSDISEDKFLLNRISGGLTNQLYYCSLNSELCPLNNEPKEVVIRLYGKKHFNNLGQHNERHNDSIVSLVMDRNKLGPKLYGLFNRGEILEYVKCKQFGIQYENDINLVHEIARKLAKFHSLSVPLKKNDFWYFDSLYQFYEESCQKFPIESMIDNYGLNELKLTNILKEVAWIIKAIKTTKSPIGFCHNDFRPSNILVKQNNHINNERILFCDFEYSSYGLRGLDFGSFFSDWGRTSIKPIEFPDERAIISFMKEYRSESIKIRGYDCALDERYTIRHLVRETKIFVLASNLSLALFCLKTNEEKEVGFNKEFFMRLAETAIISYKNNKKALIQNKIIDEWL